MLYLEGEEIDVDTLRAAIRRATIAMKLYPVFCGSALKNKGVQRLLDGVSYYLPSQLDIPPVRGVTPERRARSAVIVPCCTVLMTARSSSEAKLARAVLWSRLARWVKDRVHA